MNFQPEQLLPAVARLRTKPGRGAEYWVQATQVNVAEAPRLTFPLVGSPAAGSRVELEVVVFRTQDEDVVARIMGAVEEVAPGRYAMVAGRQSQLLRRTASKMNTAAAAVGH